MSVLLQLTLPIVLILALLLVITTNDLNTRLNKEIKRADVAENKLGNLQNDLENTPTGEIQKEFKATLEQLQIALLKQALKEEQEKVRQQLELEAHEYRLEAVNPVDLVAGRVSRELIGAMGKAYQGFGDESNKEKTRASIDGEARSRFKVLAEKVPLEQHRMDYLVTLTKENKKSYDDSLAGWVKQEEKLIANTEAKLIIRVSKDKNASRSIFLRIKDQSEQLHRDVQTMTDDSDLVGKSIEEQRRKLFANELSIIMRGAGLTLIKKTERAIGLTREQNSN